MKTWPCKYIDKDFTEKEIEKLLRKGIKKHEKQISTLELTPYVAAIMELDLHVGPRVDPYSCNEKEIINRVFKKIQLSMGVKEEDICYSWRYGY
jgi:hypothetical protein